ncbi:MAG: hypothetical protein EPN82_03680 [Bacteroidetes bacterium]|nr:MAG: hypothetical protein EPN82_03680 [Bacteroidota bacterium]
MDIRLRIKYYIFSLSFVICFLLIKDTKIIAQDFPVRSGSIIFLEKKCNYCHSIKSQAIECLDTSIKPTLDLSTVGDSLNAEIFKDFLKKKIKLKYKKHPVAFKGNNDDFEILCKWLQNLTSVVY